MNTLYGHEVSNSTPHPLKGVYTRLDSCPGRYLRGTRSQCRRRHRPPLAESPAIDLEQGTAWAIPTLLGCVAAEVDAA